jgi:hypothetical protein
MQVKLMSIDAALIDVSYEVSIAGHMPDSMHLQKESSDQHPFAFNIETTPARDAFSGTYTTEDGSQLIWKGSANVPTVELNIDALLRLNANEQTKNENGEFVIVDRAQEKASSIFGKLLIWNVPESHRKVMFPDAETPSAEEQFASSLLFFIYRIIDNALQIANKCTAFLSVGSLTCYAASLLKACRSLHRRMSLITCQKMHL